MLILLNQAFFVLHSLLIVFNIVGWAFRRTRLLHLITMGAVIFSWFVLGAFYGWGYCLCTDWHFQVRRQLGYHDSESSYIQLMAKHWAGVELSATAAAWIAGSVFAFILIAMTVVWTRVLLERFRRTRPLAAPPRSVPPAPAPG